MDMNKSQKQPKRPFSGASPGPGALLGICSRAKSQPIRTPWFAGCLGRRRRRRTPCAHSSGIPGVFSPAQEVRLASRLVSAQISACCCALCNCFAASWARCRFICARCCCIKPCCLATRFCCCAADMAVSAWWRAAFDCCSATSPRNFWTWTRAPYSLPRRPQLIEQLQFDSMPGFQRHNV
jgi:hypothetical protein